MRTLPGWEYLRAVKERMTVILVALLKYSFILHRVGKNGVESGADRVLASQEPSPDVARFVVDSVLPKRAPQAFVAGGSDKPQ